MDQQHEVSEAMAKVKTSSVPGKVSPKQTTQFDEKALINVAAEARNRVELWSRIFTDNQCKTVAEVGVWKGAFAEETLRRCPAIENYVMIDPWRHLPDWNKPANGAHVAFEDIYAEAVRRTRFAEEKLTILRERTVVAGRSLSDGYLDAAYIDGDHTLRGITIDLVTMLPKIRTGGLIGGDDFTKTIWQHTGNYDPTLVFPYAVYFAEANDLPIYSLPFEQFLIVNDPGLGFKFEDLAGGYLNLAMRELAAMPRKTLVQTLKSAVPAPLKRLLKRRRG